MAESEVLLAAIKKRCKQIGGKMHLRCADAFEIAKEHKVAGLQVAQVCNNNGIKICQCQLGLFE